MLAPPGGQKSWSPIKAVSQWWRDWSRRGSALELKCWGEDEVEYLAKDIGVSASELRRLAALGPDSPDLLLHRMAALDCPRPNLERSRNFSEFAQCARVIAGLAGSGRSGRCRGDCRARMVRTAADNRQRILYGAAAAKPGSQKA
jgi:hypothetical protein